MIGDGYRGPKNPDDFRISVRSSRHYWDPLPADELRPEGPMNLDERTKIALPAQSTIMKSIPADALVWWAATQTAEFAVDEREKWEKLDRADAVALLQRAHKKASGKAADRGTGVHEYLEKRLLGTWGSSSWDVLSDDAAPYAPCVDAFLRAQDPTLYLSEVVGIGERHGVTTDGVLGLAGRSAIVDYKTRNTTVKKPHVVYEKEVAQLGANLDLRYWIVESEETGEPTRLALPDELSAVLVTFTPTEYAIHVVDPVQAVEGFRAVLEWSTALKALPKAAKQPSIFPVEDVVPSAPEESSSSSVETRDDEGGEEAGSGVPASSSPDLYEGLGLIGELTRRIEKIQETDEHLEALRRLWPISGPLSSVTADDLPKVEKVVGQIEARFGYPFDPPPSEPVLDRFTATDVEPEPVAPTVDEGDDAPEEDVETVRKGFLFVEPDGEKWLGELTKRAGNLSISEKQSARRVLIGWSLVRLASGGWHDDEILAAVLDRAEVSTTPVDDPAPILAALSAGLARRLSDVVGELVAGELTFAVSESGGGRLRLIAA